MMNSGWKFVLPILFVLAPLASQAHRCPIPDSAAERELLLQHGPQFLSNRYHQGQGNREADCIQLIIQREKQMLYVEGMDDAELLEALMKAAYKATIDQNDIY